MFIMTADIKIGDFKPFKPNSVSWKRSIDSYSDSSLIKMPAIAMLKTTGDSYRQVESGLQFKEGMAVEVKCGYDGNNITRFKGFIRRINFSTPIEIDCEGYSYKLRQKLNITKSYPSGTKMKRILVDLVDGTGIKLSPHIPDVTIESPVVFKNASGIQVLDWFKERMVQTVYFNYDVLYVGLRQTELKDTVKFRIGWNVVKENDLKFNDRKEHSQVMLQLQSRNVDGSYTREIYDSKFSDVKVIRIYVRVDDAYRKKMAEDLKGKFVNKGYEGMITAFVVPYVEPGMAADISDSRYPERSGKYFIEAVNGEFGPGGGRQKIKIGNAL
jgi:hypothetical protein